MQAHVGWFVIQITQTSSHSTQGPPAVKRIPVFLLALLPLAPFCAAQDLVSDLKAMQAAYAASGSIVSLDSQTFEIEPAMPAPVCAVPSDADGRTTWRYYAFPLASIRVSLRDVDEKLIGQDMVFTDPDAPKTYKPGDLGDTTIVIVAGEPGKLFRTLLYDRDKYLHLGPGPHAPKDYGEAPDQTEAFALTFADPTAARAFAAALKNAVRLSKAQAAR